MEQLERYQGKAVWIDLHSGDTIDRGVVERAILRGSILTMDVRGERGNYSISLKRSTGGAYHGTWEMDRGASRGRADGQWEFNDDGRAILHGRWFPSGHLWACGLEAVDEFES